MPLGKLGMYFFLASEAMFFVGLLGSFLVLQAGQRELFHHMASVLSTWETAVLLVLLVASSAVLWIKPKAAKVQLLAVFFAAAFTIFQLLICQHLLNHHTIITRSTAHPLIYDGDMDRDGKLTGVSTNLPNGFDITRTTIADFKQMKTSAGQFQITALDILQDVPFGPWRNNYFGCYFLITATALLHLFVGMLAMLWLALKTSRGSVTAAHVDCVTIYWHFVIATGVLGLLLLYFA
jgi:heme/copper-type cytochrome/quinol oxidase subunit 3